MNGMRAGGKRDVETIELGDTKSPSPSQKHCKNIRKSEFCLQETTQMWEQNPIRAYTPGNCKLQAGEQDQNYHKISAVCIQFLLCVELWLSRR